jgi:hypothetical protein
MEVLFLIDFFPIFRNLCPSLLLEGFHFVCQLTVAVKMVSIMNFWNDTDRGNPQYLGVKPVPMPLRASQIPHGLARSPLEAGDLPSEPSILQLFYFIYKDSVCSS